MDNKFKVSYNQNPFEIVETIAKALEPFGLTIEFGEVFSEFTIAKLPERIVSDPDYEYEMFFQSADNDMIKIYGWYPIATDRITYIDKIDHYIEIGLIRKIVK